MTTPTITNTMEYEITGTLKLNDINKKYEELSKKIDDVLLKKKTKKTKKGTNGS